MDVLHVTVNFFSTLDNLITKYRSLLHVHPVPDWLQLGPAELAYMYCQGRVLQLRLSGAGLLVLSALCGLSTSRAVFDHGGITGNRGIFIMPINLFVSLNLSLTNI
jgi:hypothetical protein